MNERDEKIRREILISSYDGFEEHVRSNLDVEQMVENLDNFPDDEVIYNSIRLQDQRYVTLEKRAGKFHGIHITPNGIEKLEQDGYETLLQSNLRYDVLRSLYEDDRNSPYGVSYLTGNEIAEELDENEKKVVQNLWYLQAKRLIETERRGTHSSHTITDRGRNKYELYETEGTPIPDTQPLTKWTQHSVGPNEPEKARNLFRDITELAQDKITIVDWYFRKEAYDLVENVPSTVNIKILTSYQASDDEQEYHGRVQEFIDGRDGSVEVRFVDYYDYEARLFHARYLIRDELEGWTWDHSFVDAGKTQHPISQVRPINLESTLETFEEVWKKGEVIDIDAQ